jgi:hypothetical protein
VALWAQKAVVLQSTGAASISNWTNMIQRKSFEISDLVTFTGIYQGTTFFSPFVFQHFLIFSASRASGSIPMAK